MRIRTTVTPERRRPDSACRTMTARSWAETGWPLEPPPAPPGSRRTRWPSRERVIAGPFSGPPSFRFDQTAQPQFFEVFAEGFWVHSLLFGEQTRIPRFRAAAAHNCRSVSRGCRPSSRSCSARRMLSDASHCPTLSLSAKTASKSIARRLAARQNQGRSIIQVVGWADEGGPPRRCEVRGGPPSSAHPTSPSF